MLFRSYLSFVPDGEPTLDSRLGETIDLLKPLEIEVAVISNASLIRDAKVRKDLSKADWVSVKVDGISERIWRKINRPHKSLDIEGILKGIEKFADEFDGTLATETMLVDGVNDGPEELERVADFLGKISPNETYISIPTRPPAEKWVRSPSEQVLTEAYQIFESKLDSVEHLLGYEGNEFASSGDPREDLLSITSVHPMREEGVRELLKKTETDWSLVEDLMAEDKIVRAEYEGEVYYTRKLDNQ